MSRTGPFIITVSGRKFFPLDPNPSDILIEDIAHALSNLCRWTGHVKEFYSVAQHSVLVAEHLPPHLALQGLLHDATEAYMADVNKPMKSILPDYQQYEAQLQIAICERFGLRYPLDYRVKEEDTRSLATEKRDLMPGASFWSPTGEPWATKIEPQPPREAREDFLYLYRELTK